MSSIYGIINFNNRPVEYTQINAMEAALNHWGADDKGQWLNNSCGIGHLMLYNTPESLHEKLPLFNPAKQLVITADARIDNRDELFDKLYPEGVEKEKIPDSSLILKAYEQYGEDCVKHLIGDFAFAIWDAIKQKLLCARDHLGIKPFFYYQDDNFFAFASEKKALLALTSLNKTVNEDYILKIISNILPQANETAYTQINRLCGAQQLVLKEKSCIINKYWDLDIYKEIKYDDPQEYISNFRKLFEEAIRCRLRSAYPVGTELSGGLDSSGITCIAADLLHQENRQLYSFSYGLNPADILPAGIKTEEHFADEVISFAKVDHAIKVRSSGYSHFLEEDELAIKINDGPYHHSIWHAPLKKAAGKNGVRALLSGFPGDELVTSYHRRYVMEYAITGDYKTYFKIARKLYGPKGFVLLFLEIKTGKHFKFFNPLQLRRQVSAFKKNEKNFLSTAYFKRVQQYIKRPLVFKNFRHVQKDAILKSVISERMELEDRTGLIYHTETRFPMADIRLIEYMLAIPFTQKVNEEMRRWLYRTAMKGTIPDAVINRTDKAGLMQPFILNELRTAQGQRTAWLQHLKTNNQIPAYINTSKLFKDYFDEISGKPLRDISVKKITQNFLYWKILNN